MVLHRDCSLKSLGLACRSLKDFNSLARIISGHTISAGSLETPCSSHLRVHTDVTALARLLGHKLLKMAGLHRFSTTENFPVERFTQDHEIDVLEWGSIILLKHLAAEKKFLKEAILDSKRTEMVVMRIRLVASSSQILGRVHSALEQVRATVILNCSGHCCGNDVASEDMLGGLEKCRTKHRTGFKTKFKTKFKTRLMTTLRTNSCSDRMAFEKVLVILHLTLGEYKNCRCLKSNPTGSLLKAQAKWNKLPIEYLRIVGHRIKAVKKMGQAE
ncbi:hypothetical protein BU17DRAFT_66790 [Hysterangium stoloniferum]|nr:hypothetical protein BU17DRAFT_66790 [Hysterangium stoloniferum]